MNLNDYQTEAHDYAAYGDCELYPFLGLAGETGEVCEKMKKIMRANPEKRNLKDLSVDEKRGLLSEISDVLWYASEITGLLGSDLETVAQMNLTKLSGRREAGTITSADRAEDATYE